MTRAGRLAEQVVVAGGSSGPFAPDALVASIAAQLGSVQEARWIVDQAGAGGAQALADRRASGEPLQYVLGRWPFRTIDLRVDRRALIPRPETEQVVEVALDVLRDLRRVDGPTLSDPSPSHRTAAPSDRLVCVDLGTGTGAIALSLAVEGGALCPGLEVWATDDSEEALALAGENLGDLARSHPGASARVRIAGGRWFEALPPGLAGQVDLIVSNPPYVAGSEYPGLDPTVREWEPYHALVAADGAGGTGGLAAVEAIVAGAPRWLGPSGILVVEIAPSQAEASMAAARRAGLDRVGVERDLAGRSRMLVARC